MAARCRPARICAGSEALQLQRAKPKSDSQTKLCMQRLGNKSESMVVHARSRIERRDGRSNVRSECARLVCACRASGMAGPTPPSRARRKARKPRGRLHLRQLRLLAAPEHGRASAARLAAIPAGESPANRGVQSLL